MFRDRADDLSSPSRCSVLHRTHQTLGHTFAVNFNEFKPSSNRLVSVCVCGRWRECIRPRVDLQMFVQANREPPVVPHLVWNEYLRRIFRFDFGERYNGDAAFACVAVKLKKKTNTQRSHLVLAFLGLCQACRIYWEFYELPTTQTKNIVKIE